MFMMNHFFCNSKYCFRIPNYKIGIISLLNFPFCISIAVTRQGFSHNHFAISFKLQPCFFAAVHKTGKAN